MGRKVCPVTSVRNYHYSLRNSPESAFLNDKLHYSSPIIEPTEQDQDGTAVSSWSCAQAVSKPVWHIPLLCVQWKTPYDRMGNCPKHVEFYPKNTFEKLVHLVGFIIRIYHVARSPERQILLHVCIVHQWRLKHYVDKIRIIIKYLKIYLKLLQHVSDHKGSIIRELIQCLAKITVLVHLLDNGKVF